MNPDPPETTIFMDCQRAQKGPPPERGRRPGSRKERDVGDLRFSRRSSVLTSVKREGFAGRLGRIGRQLERLAAGIGANQPLENRSRL